jgi:hypothetical protein
VAARLSAFVRERARKLRIRVCLLCILLMRERVSGKIVSTGEKCLFMCKSGQERKRQRAR